jgi:NADH:ubiquinone oxidoreductase subunit 6 (subunit J)
MIPTVIFWAVVLMTVVSAVVVVVARNILHAAFSLCLTFLGVAALYVFLHADFVAAVQLIVYVGGILVLIMFAVMFSSNVVEDTAEGGRNKIAMAAGGAAALAIFVAVVLMNQKLAKPLEQAQIIPPKIVQTAAAKDSKAEDQPKYYGELPFSPTISVQPGQIGLGHLLMGKYLLPFEVVSILLLAALVGAVVIVRKELKS